MPKTGYMVMTMDSDTYDELSDITTRAGLRRRTEALRMIMREWKMFKQMVLGKETKTERKNEQTVVMPRNRIFSACIPNLSEEWG